MNKKGFTLIEVLAVIVILSVLLLLAVPKLTNKISTSKENLSKENLTILREAALKYINEVYTSSTATYQIVTSEELISKGYITPIIDVYDESNTCNGYVVISNLDTTPIATPYIDCNNNGFRATYQLVNTGKLIPDATPDANLRFSGGDGASGTEDDLPNYVSFNNELWRIIGIFNVSDGTKTEPRLKIIRKESLGLYSWDTSPSDYNEGKGYNVWETKEGKTKDDGTAKADINELLNDLYYSDKSGITCYNGPNNATNTCPTARLNSTAKNMMGDAIWNLGGIEYSNPSETPYGLPTVDTYIKERGTNIYWSTIAKTEWTGKVGLIYPSDYGYASTDNECRTNIRSGITYSPNYNPKDANCKNDNWLNKAWCWTMSPYSNSITAISMTTGTVCPMSQLPQCRTIIGGGVDSNDSCISAFYVRPVVYLKSSVKITSGDGSYALPYQLSL